MKKRLISMLLTVLMVASLFGGMSVSAYADEEYATTEYTLKEGDTLLKVCNKLGLNWYGCQTAINKLNNISEAQYRKLSVGQVIKLPATNEDAAKIAKTTISSGSGSTGGSVISGGSTGGSTGTVSNVNAAYWLIPYTMQKGETVAGVCNTLGISFATYSDQIKTINNISTWSKVAAGKTLLLPSASAPAAGTSCYAVVAHQVQKGETTYSICNEYGISYNANASLLQTLNKGTSLTNIKYGRTLYVPVSTVTSSGSTGSSGGSVISGGSSSSGSGSTSGSGSSSTTKTYKLTSTTTGGKVNFTVNGQTVTSAAAGSTVTVVPAPNSGYGLDSISLKFADGSAVPKITDGTFTMPSCDVRVTATFKKGYYMGPSSEHGTVTLYNKSSGVVTSTAAEGSEIKVVINPDPGYVITRIYIQRNDGRYKIIKDLAKNGDSFTMPDCPVFVCVEYQDVATYSLTKGSGTLNGSFKLKVNGSEVTKAAAGAVVEVVCSPASGYTAKDENIDIYNDAYGTTTHPTEGKFIMPAANVTVNVKFTDGEAEKYAIAAKEVTEGTVSFKVGTDSVTKAEAGKPVTVEGVLKTAYPGYILSGYTVKSNYGEQSYSAADTFTMPASDVTVTPVFKVKTIPLTVKNDETMGTVTVTCDGVAVAHGANVNAYGYITVSAVAKPGYKVSDIKINTKSGTSAALVGTETAVNVEVLYEALSPVTLSVDTTAEIAANVKVKLGDGSEVQLSSYPTLSVWPGEKLVFTYTVEGGGYLIVENTGANKVTIADNETKVVTVTMPDGNASITIK